MKVFIRLTDLSYSRNSLKVLPRNILEKAEKLINIDKSKFTHSGINISLADNYYSMIQSGVFVESLTRNKDLSPNSYMSIYSIDCNRDQYIRVCDLLDKSLQIKTYYDLGRLPIFTGSILTKRLINKFNNLTSIDSHNDIDEQYLDNFQYNKFVCSSYVAYVLYLSIPSIRKFYLRNKLHVLNTSVPELLKLPGMQYEYSCYLGDYIDTTMDFINDNPEYKIYL